MSRSLLRLGARLPPTALSLGSAPATAVLGGVRQAVAVRSGRPSQARSLAQPSTAPFAEPAGINPAAAEGFSQATEKLHDYGQYLTSCLPKYLSQYTVYKDELTVFCAPQDVLHVLRFLKDHSQCLYRACMDITAVDYPTRENRFEVVYNLLSHAHASRIRVKTFCSELTPVPSAVPIFRGADWFEREVWDMFGIFFEGHPDLRRILTDYGFEGHPLRKDFPLTGYTEVRYSEEKKRVIYEPLQLTQAFRNFESASPWEQVGPGVETRPESFKIPEPKKEEEQKK